MYALSFFIKHLTDSFDLINNNSFSDLSTLFLHENNIYLVKVNYVKNYKY